MTRFGYTDQKGKREIDLSGFANAASEIIPILEKSKYFEDVKFKSSIVKDRSTEKEKFNRDGHGDQGTGGCAICCRPRRRAAQSR